MIPLILFVDGFPVQFHVNKNGNHYFLQPIENPYNKPVPKMINAIIHDSHWSISGTDDQNLIDQIIEDLMILSEL